MSKYANKGKGLEDLVEYSNKQYKAKGMALVQKISTPWTVIRKGKKIVSAFPSGKSTLDFRGTIKGGTSISFDCKETINEKGLPLENIADHQIEYMRAAIEVGEVTFIVVHMKATNRYFRIVGADVVGKWDTWQLNKGRRGFNTIFEQDMQEIKQGRGVAIDYLIGIV